MERKNNTTFYSIGLASIKKKLLRQNYAFNPEKYTLLIRLKILFE